MKKTYSRNDIIKALKGLGASPDLMPTCAGICIANKGEVAHIGANYCHRIYSSNTNEPFQTRLIKQVKERLDRYNIEHEISIDEDNYLIVYVKAKDIDIS